MLVAVVVFLNGDFYISGLLFLAIGTPPWLLRPVKVSISSELYHGYFQLLYFCQAFSSGFFTASATVFVCAFFTHRCFFTLHSFPTFLVRFVTQMWTGTPHSGSSSVPALTELSLPADAWT